MDFVEFEIDKTMETPSSTSSTGSSSQDKHDDQGQKNLNAKYQKLAAEYAKVVHNKRKS